MRPLLPVGFRTVFKSISSTGTNLSRERQYQLGTRFTF
jgi:hypothetical protein